MQSDWTYLKFAVYHPAKRKELAEYIQKFCAQGKKALIYINDMEAGAEMQELLGDSQRIYSSDDKKDEIQKIALQEGFDASALVTTKVAENGWSIHDDNLSLIVAETCDMVELQQIIGRARVGRKKPREIQVLIPDYDLSLLGNMEGKLYMQLSAFQKAADNPDFALQYLNQPNPYVCYDAILKASGEPHWSSAAANPTESHKSLEDRRAKKFPCLCTKGIGDLRKANRRHGRIIPGLRYHKGLSAAHRISLGQI